MTRFFTRLRLVAGVFLSTLALIGILPLSALAEPTVSFSTNISYQSVAPGNPVTPVWMSVSTSSHESPIFSLSTNMPGLHLVFASPTRKGMSGTVPSQLIPGDYTIFGRVSINGQIRYARSVIHVTSPGETSFSPSQSSPSQSLQVSSHNDSLFPRITGGQALSIAAGNFQTCVVTTHHQVKCWGRNTHGQVGNAAIGSLVARPYLVPTLSHATQVSAGNYFSCALANGRVYCWGDNQHNELAHPGYPFTSQPVVIQGLPSSITSITSGSNHSCALDKAGSIYCWGDSSFGQLGNGTSGVNLDHATRVRLDEPARAVSAGSYHTCAVTASGKAYCWGENDVHQLGSIRQTPISAPNPLPLAVEDTTSYIDIHAGYDFTCGLTVDRHVKCWGSNSHGQLGSDLNASEHTQPVTVHSLSHVRFFATGYYHACAIDMNNDMKCWGDNADKQLGFDSTVDYSSSVSNGYGNEYGPFARLALGASHTCAITTRGEVYCWGDQSNGQLGNNVQANPYSSHMKVTSEPVSPQW